MVRLPFGAGVYRLQYKRPRRKVSGHIGNLFLTRTGLYITQALRVIHMCYARGTNTRDELKLVEMTWS